MDYLLKATAITAIFYVFYKILLQHETFFKANRWFLLTGLIATLLIPFVIIPIYIVQEPIALNNFNFETTTNQSLTDVKSINWSLLLQRIYSLGVLVFSLKFITSLWSLKTLITSNKKEKKGIYNFIETTNKTTPFSFFNYIVYNPKQFKKEELQQIITHEKVHVNQHHTFDMLLSEIITIVCWFNPFSWLYKKEIQQNLEFIADAIAQQKTKCNISYQRLLLKSYLPQKKLALTNNFYNSLIKKRIIMLHKNRSKSTNQWKFTLILPILIVFVLNFNTKVIAQVKVIEIEEITEDEIPKNTKINSFSFGINKNSSDKDLKKLSSFLKTKEIKEQFGEITTKIKGVKRNNKKEITAIKITLESKNTKTNYNTVSNTEPIKPIQITVNLEKNDISINSINAKKFHFVSDDMNNYTVTTITIDSNGKITTKNTQPAREIREKLAQGEKIIYSPNEEKNYLYYTNNKISTYKDVSNINPDDIDNITIIKGEKAIEKYGKKGKDGVILITTKKEK